MAQAWSRSFWCGGLRSDGPTWGSSPRPRVPQAPEQLQSPAITSRAWAPHLKLWAARLVGDPRMGEWEAWKGSYGKRPLPAQHVWVGLALLPQVLRERPIHSPQGQPKDPPPSGWVLPTGHNGSHVPAWPAGAKGGVWGQAGGKSRGAPPPRMDGPSQDQSGRPIRQCLSPPLPAAAPPAGEVAVEGPPQACSQCLRSQQKGPTSPVSPPWEQWLLGEEARPDPRPKPYAQHGGLPGPTHLSAPAAWPRAGRLP